MVSPGDTLEDPTMEQRIYPTAGQRIVFRKTAQETNSESLEFDVFMKPGAPPMRDHIHPKQEERLEVVSGSVHFRVGGRFRVDGREQSSSAGQVLVIPPGTSHGFWNIGDDEAHLIVEFRPALQIETFFQTIFDLAQNRKTWFPELWQTAVVLRKYKNEVYPVLPPLFVQIVPLFVQKWLVGLLSLIGRIRGYKACYPRYSGSE